MAERRVERVVREADHALKASRLERLQPGPLLEEAVPERQGHRQVVGRDHRAEDAGIGRRQLGVEFGHRSARHQEAETVGERAQETLDLVRARGQRVEGDHHAGGRPGRDDAALVAAVEGLALAGLFAFRGLRDLGFGPLRGVGGLERRRCGGTARQAHEKPASIRDEAAGLSPCLVHHAPFPSRPIASPMRSTVSPSVRAPSASARRLSDGTLSKAG